MANRDVTLTVFRRSHKHKKHRKSENTEKKTKMEKIINKSVRMKTKNQKKYFHTTHKY